MSTFRHAVAEILFARKLGAISHDEAEALLHSMLSTARLSNDARQLLLASKHSPPRGVVFEGHSDDLAAFLEAADESPATPNRVAEFLPALA